MLITYAFTTALASAGGQDRALLKPWVPLAMGGKILSDVLTNLTLTREEWQENKALCFYCQVANVVSVASLALAVPEVVRAARNAFGSGPNREVQG